MWHFKDNKDLVGVAFIDTEIYVHTAHALKNFILIGDVTRSVQLLRYQVCAGVSVDEYVCGCVCGWMALVDTVPLQENLKTLSLISQDPLPANVYACGYVIDGHQLSFIGVLPLVTAPPLTHPSPPPLLPSVGRPAEPHAAAIPARV